MPLYEFKCPKCGNKIEVLNTPTASAWCSKCGAEMEKIVSAPAFRVYTKVR